MLLIEREKEWMLCSMYINCGLETKLFQWKTPWTIIHFFPPEAYVATVYTVFCHLKRDGFLKGNISLFCGNNIVPW
jgi:hypothetical protein